MRKIPKINKSGWMANDTDYYRCDDCGKTLDRQDYLEKC